VRPRTLAGYELICREHIVPVIGRVPVAKLTARQVQAMLNGKTRVGASAQTVRNIHAVLRRALNQAQRWGIVQHNLASLVELPRLRRREVAALSPAEARAIIHALSGDRISSLVTVALATGLRLGELLGMRWQDLDLDAGVLTVRHSLQRLPGRGPELVEPKTARSRRSIVLGRSTLAALRSHRATQLEDRIWAGNRWREGDFVFTTSVGTPMLAGDVTKRFQARLASASLPRMRFHDLRHGSASLLLSQGVHPRVVMELLGHSTIALTMNTYSHVIPQLEREAADRMESVLTG
jgi:integrase